MPSDFFSHFFEANKIIILITAFVALFIAESIFKLRRRFQSRLKRIFINVMLAVPAFVLARLMLAPALIWLAYKNESWHFGLNYLYNAPLWIKNIIAFSPFSISTSPDYHCIVWNVKFLMD